MTDVQHGHWLSLDAPTVYALSRLRYRVYTMGQGITEVEDLDGKDLDPNTETWWISIDAEPVSTLRVLQEAEGVVSIGRVATDQSHRGQGLAGKLMRAAMAAHTGDRIEIHAQAHLEQWYTGFGAQRVGAIYEEAGIPHVTMVREPITAEGAPDDQQRQRVRDRLAADLSESQVAYDEATLDSYATDHGPLTDWVPQQAMAVVFPDSTEDVIAVVRLANELNFAIVARGAGTSVSGGTHALAGAVTVSLERMNRIRPINVEDQTAVVGPGVINADLGEAAAAHHLMYAPDPASYRMSTIGGNVATNAGGLRCAKYGVTRDSVLSVEAVLADGTVINTGTGTFKNVSGYDLTGLFVGSEGTLGIITRITLRLRPAPVRVENASVFVPDLETAAAAVLAISQAGVTPSILEMMDGATMASLDGAHGSDLRSQGGACLLVQTDGYGAEAEMQAIRTAVASLDATVSEPGNQQAHDLVELRRHARGDDVATEVRVGEDVAVPKSKLVDYVREVQRIARDHDVHVKVIAHAGDGNLHPNFWVGTEEGTAGLVRLDAALDESIQVALDFGGTMTGEHGVGSYKVRWFAMEHAPEVVALQRKMKAVFDPAGRLNPDRGIG